MVAHTVRAMSESNCIPKCGCGCFYFLIDVLIVVSRIAFDCHAEVSRPNSVKDVHIDKKCSYTGQFYVKSTFSYCTCVLGGLIF